MFIIYYYYIAHIIIEHINKCIKYIIEYITLFNSKLIVTIPIQHLLFDIPS